MDDTTMTIHGNDVEDIFQQIKGVPDAVRFTKIKYGGDPLKLTITYQKKNDIDGWDDLQMSTRQEPHPDFIQALDGLSSHLCKMCEQGEDAICDAKSVSVSWTNEVMGVVISGSRTLMKSYSPLNINTPHKTVEPYSDHEDEKQLLDSNCVIAVEDLFREAWAFVEGKRKQADLFEED